MRTIVRIAGMIALVSTCWSHPAPGQHTRPLHPQDVIRRERLVSSLSPDGRFLLYLRVTPFVHPGPRLFVVNLASKEEHEIVCQIDRRARIIAWGWSPSGQRIAVAGLIGPATTVWFGDRDSDRLDPIIHPRFRTSDAPAMVWASEDEIILSTLADETISTIAQAQDLTARQWAKSNEGIEPSRSILENGVDRGRMTARLGSWMLLNVRENSATSISDGGIPTQTVAAHNGTAIASLFRVSAPRLDLPGLIPESGFASALDGLALTVVKVEQGALVRRQFPELADVAGDGLSWSPDSGKLAFLARRAAGGRALRVFVYDRRGDSLAEMNTDGLSGPVSLSPFVWTARGSLTGLMQPTVAAGKSPGRPDWWAIRPDRPPRNLTAGITVDPIQMAFQLSAEPAGSLAGQFGTDFWRLDPEGGPPVKVSAKTLLSEPRVEWPLDSRATGQVLVSARRGDARFLGRFDTSSGEFTEIARPPAEGRLIAFHPATEASVFDVAARNELSLWASAQAGAAPARIAEANVHLRGVAEPAMKAIQYKDAKGQQLHGWLVLPPEYTADRRWPMVAYVYPGTVFSDLAKPWLDDDVQLLAAHGYVVLRPSMPRAKGSPPSDPYDALAEQVLPAVDKAIELGIADPQRLGVMGHSFGGYAVYGLVTQTMRFRAAIASAGTTDLVSQYGQFSSRLARSDVPLDDTHHVSWSESGQCGLGNPLWRDLPRYVHNSPIQYVGRVETPLLMLHGDQDFVPIQQAEEFYTSLARRGKRARFVRYWGEGHMILSSPANYLDYWQQIYAWFDELLAKPSGR